MKNVLYYISLATAFYGMACGIPATSSRAATQPLRSEQGSSLDSLVYQSENLIIRQLSSHVYVHTSFLETESFGRVPCNGMVVLHAGEAVVFDTPADNKSSLELIDYFNRQSNTIFKGVVSTHFHADCVGGLKAFHEHHIPSYAGRRTINLLKDRDADSQFLPQHSFDEHLVLPIGDLEVYAGYFGEGHTPDNVIGYFPEDGVMFGGCLIKEMGAGKGNLEDANVAAWPATVKAVKQKFPETAVVIPGHGEIGGMELLDYTISLFE